MNHEDMTYTEAKDILENYIHTEFFDRKDSDVGQAIVKSIMLLNKESEKEIKYKEQYNYYNAPKRFLHCPVCDYNRKHYKNKCNKLGEINITECPQCGFSVIILRTERNRSSYISDAMRRTCWNKAYNLYKNGAKNESIAIPWQTYYANSMKTEKLHIRYGFNVDDMLKTLDI